MSSTNHESAAATPARLPRRGELFRGWAGALVGYLIGSYGCGLAINTMLHAGRGDLAMALLWLPWIVGALLCGVGAGLAVPAVRDRQWWTWAVAAAPIPLGMFVVMLWGLADIAVLLGQLLRDALVQVVIAAAVATAIGVLRDRGRSRDAEGVR